ncbi:MAG TPA: metal-dependent transcriptional regulator [Candidatus Treponema faecavium]|nr:metal-dependent transcriptional regulator [Candidatus Treponema faecavium]
MYESGENYLETIYRLHRSKGFVRSIDVARALNVSKPSVSRAMSILREGGFIHFGDGGEIILTEAGNQKAADIYSRHVLLTDFLMRVAGVPAEVAESNACRIEHIVDEDVVQGIRRFMEQ